MGWISRCILTLQLFVLLIGSVGINVFRHTCEEDGTITSYFLNVENHCSEDAEELPSCCQKRLENSDSKCIKKDCCTDAFSYLHYQPLTDFQSDDVATERATTAPIQLAVHPTDRLFPRKANLVKINSTKPPPGLIKKHGINLLIQHGILRL